MSLINEALKKAQRSRHGGNAPDGSDAADGAAGRRDPRKGARSTLLLVAGAVVLVVLSMVFTALWLTRTSSPREVAMAKPAISAPTAAAPDASAPTPVLVVPNPTSGGKPTPGSAVKAATGDKPATTRQLPSIAIATPPGGAAPVANPGAVPSESPAPSSPAAMPPDTAPAKSDAPPAKPSPEIQKFIDAIRVTGIRSSGNESKVLMNDRVYRVNDVVDHALGIKLTKVAPDGLTFVDQNGAVYVKYF